MDPLPTASENDIITAEIWNKLIEKIIELHQRCVGLSEMVPGYIVISVRNEETGRALGAEEINSISAVPSGAADSQFHAKRVGDGEDLFVISNLAKGTYEITVNPTLSSGYSSKTETDVVVESGGATSINILVEREGPTELIGLVPALFGMNLQAALDELVNAGIEVDQVIDAHAAVVTISGSLAEGYTAPAEYAATLLISTEPGEGRELAEGEMVNLLVSIPAESD